MKFAFTVHVNQRPTLRAALELCERKAKAAVTTNRHLELTNAERESGELESLCAESIQFVDAMTGTRLEINAKHMYASRTALRVFVGTVRKKEKDLTQTLALGGEHKLDEVEEHIKHAEDLLRALDNQSDAFAESAEPVTDTAPDALATAEDEPDAATPYAEADEEPAALDDDAPTNEATLALVKGGKKRAAKKATTRTKRGRGT